MSRRPLYRPPETRGGRDATRVQVIETIDHVAPETKADLAEAVGISEQYLSEHLQRLKREGIVRKAYVVDEAALHEHVDSVSRLTDGDGGAQRADDGQPGEAETGDLLERLERLDEVTRAQYDAARAVFEGEEPSETPDQLEGLANERHAAVMGELKSFTLATEWPGNRVAGDLATVATNLEIVGDRACFVADVIETHEAMAAGVVADRVSDVFEAGQRIGDLMGAILFEADLERFEELRTTEAAVHRDLDELFELVTAYDAELYGHLATVTRALERAIFYWVHTAELAVRLHSGQQPEHVTL